jgi:hypothetical protein
LVKKNFEEEKKNFPSEGGQPLTVKSSRNKENTNTICFLTNPIERQNKHVVE